MPERMECHPANSRCFEARDEVALAEVIAVNWLAGSRRKHKLRNFGAFALVELTPL